MKQYLTIWLAVLALLGCTFAAEGAHAQADMAKTVTACGTPGNTPVVGNTYPITQDTTGGLCTTGSTTVVGTVAVVGNTASGSTDSGAPVKIGGVFRTTQPTFSDGQRADWQLDARGNGHVSLYGAGSPTAIGLTVPSAAAISGPNSLDVAAFPYAYNGTNFSPIQVDAVGNLKVVPQGSATGGASVKSIQAANNTTSIAIDASPGTLYGLTVFNNSATIAYAKLYNAAQGSTTCGSGTPIQRVLIPASTTGAGAVIPLPVGVIYSTAITLCITTGFADSDTTAPAASTYIVEAVYK